MAFGGSETEVIPKQFPLGERIFEKPSPTGTRDFGFCLLNPIRAIYILKYVHLLLAPSKSFCFKSAILHTRNSPNMTNVYPPKFIHVKTVFFRLYSSGYSTFPRTLDSALLSACPSLWNARTFCFRRNFRDEPGPRQRSGLQLSVAGL